MTSLQIPALIRFASLPASRWRNGGGSTTEIAVAGDDSAFAWRLSLAEIERAGAFSVFPGTARILTVVQGQGLTLVINGTQRRPGRNRPFHFSGDASTDAVLSLGPVWALNLITRRGAVRAHVTVIELYEGLMHQLRADQIAVLISGHAMVTDGRARSEIFQYDAIRGDRQEGLSVHGLGHLALISIEQLT